MVPTPQILFNYLNEPLSVKRHLNGLLKICKLYPIWDLRPPALLSHFEEVERQLREKEDGIYDIKLELEVNSIKG